MGFYETDDDLVAAVAAFFAEGLHAHGTAVAVAIPEHRDALEHALASAGVSVEALMSDGRFRALDARTTLDTFMRNGSPDPEAFATQLGRVLSESSLRGQPVCVFGEMVALLWADGNISAAIELESLWNELSTQHEFTLYCGYPLSILETPDDLAATKQVCDHHSSVVSLTEADGAGSTVVMPAEGGEGIVRMFVPTRPAVRAVRAFVDTTMRAWGADRLVREDAGIVASELATNALIHAQSPFSVSITRTAGGAKVAVRDASSVVPRLVSSNAQSLSGRGIAMIEALSSSWGIRDETDGKTVWVELSATI